MRALNVVLMFLLLICMRLIVRASRAFELMFLGSGSLSSNGVFVAGVQCPVALGTVEVFTLLLIKPVLLTFQFIEACDNFSLSPEFCAFFCRHAPLVSQGNMNAGVFIHAR
jgi:hypothetical protein